MDILVYSATGVQASPLLLQSQNSHHRIFGLSRNPSEVSNNAGSSVNWLSIDYKSPQSFLEATKGKDVIFLNLPFFGNSKAGKYAIDAAKEAKVKHIIWNANGAVPNETTGRKALNVRLENMELLVDSGIPYSVFQPSIYLENLLFSKTLERLKNYQILEGISPPDAAIPYISVDDICTCMWSALNRSDRSSKAYFLTGIGWTGNEIAATLSEVLDKEISYRQIPVEQYLKVLDEDLGMGNGATIMGMEADKYSGPFRPAGYAPLESLDAFEEFQIQPMPLKDWILENRSQLK